MSGPMFAGQLCATQVGGSITIEDDDWQVREIRHKHDRHGPMLILKSYTTHLTRTLVLPPDAVVLVGDPSPFESLGSRP
jgi:hypothetical protein